ncbi:carotenoid oxygenase family protein [Pseudonocardia sp.]|uniref:carotenoid oxygenase family protein n=1 Tax=Pseudonocardia sp. TaxID=60912 RepID=UPI0039C940CF
MTSSPSTAPSWSSLDAQDLDRGPVATAWLSHHIPWGFHGTFTRRVAAIGAPVPSAPSRPGPG